jgi:YesN/AraC family two-component response regulator
VDDEIRNHHVWAKLINWQEKGFIVAGTATDGREALELFQKECPDFMLIDIKMPIMDGLECIRRIRAISSSVKLVLITAFSEFAYAQEAINCKVSGYLLKPVKRTALFEMVDKIARELKVEQEREDSFQAAKEKQYTTELELSLQSMISKRPSIHNFDVLYRFPLVVADFHFYEKNSLLRTLPSGDETLRILEDWMAENHFKSAAQFQIPYNRIVLLLPVQRDLIEKFPYVVQQFEKQGILCDAYLLEEPLRQDNFDIVRFRLQETEDRGFYLNSGSFGSLLESLDSCEDKIFPMGDRYITLALEKFSAEPLIEYARDEFQRAAKNRIKPRIVKESCFELLERLKMTIRIIYVFDHSDLLSNISLSEILKITKLGRLCGYMERAIGECFSCFSGEASPHDRRRSLVFKVNAYTSMHFSSRNFSVRQVADYVGLSKNYITKMYKEISGMGFWEYVTRLRMEKAKHLLLSTGDTINAIADTVGYNSEYHFSRKFKEYTAMSPGTYRKYPPGL